MVEKSSKGVSVSVVILSFPTLKLSRSALKYVPAAPEFPGQPILKPPEIIKLSSNIHENRSTEVKAYKKFPTRVIF